MYHNETLIKIFYGLRKFGSKDEKLMGSNIELKDSITKKHPVLISIKQKHNGEAGWFSAMLINDEIKYVFCSKTVPLVIANRSELDNYTDNGLKTVKEIATIFFDIFDRLSSEDKEWINSILLEYTIPIEKIDRVFKHIAVEESGLYILLIRNTETDLPLDNLEILNKFVSLGFKKSRNFSNLEIFEMIYLVYMNLDELPKTSDKPSKIEFEEILTFLEPIEYIDSPIQCSGDIITIFNNVWAYVSLMIEIVRNLSMSAHEILTIATGDYSRFTLTEGYSINIFDHIKKRYIMIKTKDVSYYILRSIREIVSKYRHTPYDNIQLSSASFSNWKQYLPESWKIDDFIELIQNYMRSSLFSDYMKSLKEKTMLDAPDFYNQVKLYSENPIDVSYKATIIGTIESELPDIIKLLTDNGFRFAICENIKTLTNLTNSSITLVSNVRISALKNDALIIAHTSKRVISKENMSSATPIEKKENAFVQDLLKCSNITTSCEELLYRLQNDRIPIIPEIQEKISHYETKYFECNTKIPETLIKLVFNTKLNSQKFSDEIKPIHREMAELCSSISEMPPRNLSQIDEIVHIISSEYEFGKKLTVFLTGVPGIGKDHLASEIQHNILFARLHIINQDQYEGDPGKYLRGLEKVLQENDIIIITRNGPGSLKSIEKVRQAKSKICLISPNDDPFTLIFGACMSALRRKESDPTHSISLIEDNAKIVLIICNFYGILTKTNFEILGITNNYLGIKLSDEYEEEHVTLNFGAQSNLEYIDTKVSVLARDIITISSKYNSWQFIRVSEIIGENGNILTHLVSSGYPHITLNSSGPAIHSLWWCHLLANATSIEGFSIKIESHVIEIDGEILLF